MKAQGRPKRKLTDIQIKIAEEYLLTNSSYKDMTEKHSITKAQIRYIVKRYKEEVLMKKKFQWVNESVVIDFPVSKVMRNTMEEAEQYDMENNVSEYNAVSEMIELFGKEGFVNGLYTKEQWQKLCERYPYV